MSRTRMAGSRTGLSCSTPGCTGTARYATTGECNSCYARRWHRERYRAERAALGLTVKVYTPAHPPEDQPANERAHAAATRNPARDRRWEVNGMTSATRAREAARLDALIAKVDALAAVGKVDEGEGGLEPW